MSRADGIGELRELVARNAQRLDALEAKIGHTGESPPDDRRRWQAGAAVRPPRRRALRREHADAARWDETPGLGFPPVIYIKDRRYRSLAALEQWDRSLARRAATQGQVRGHGGRFKAADAGGAEADDLEAEP